MTNYKISHKINGANYVFRDKNGNFKLYGYSNSTPTPTPTPTSTPASS
jgi:hypothetical protein